jgi:hypothetical protein
LIFNNTIIITTTFKSVCVLFSQQNKEEKKD